MENIIFNNAKSLPHIDHIIWLSDIHIQAKSKGESTTDNLLVEFSNCFKLKIEELSIDTSKITYVLVSGDISFSSEDSQYEYIKELLIQMVPENYKDCFKFIWCPGNHDISWQNFISNYHFISKDLNNFFKDRNKYFNEDLPNTKVDFDKLFYYYTNNLSYKKNQSNSLFCLENSDSIKVSDRYRDTGLEGYVVDDSSKSIFIIVNTAWYCRGRSLGKFIETFKKDMDSKEIITLIENSQEAGSLITGFRTQKSKAIVTDILSLLDNEKYNDYLKITFMHHPLDWLDPEEIHSYKANLQQEGTVLTKILRKSSVLLTGHVHPTKVNRVEYLYSLNLMHFRAPMLIHHYNNKEEDVGSIFPCNGFGVFKIDRKNERFELQYYEVEYSSSKGFIITESGMPTPSESYIKTGQVQFKRESIPFKNKVNNVSNNYEHIETTEYFNFKVFKNDSKLENKPHLITKYFNIYKIIQTSSIELTLVPKDKNAGELLFNMNVIDNALIIDLIKKITKLGLISNVTLAMPGNYITGIRNTKSDFEDDNSKLILQKNADRILNRFRTNLYNYIDCNIEENNEIELLFTNIESCRFNVSVVQSKWFLKKT